MSKCSWDAPWILEFHPSKHLKFAKISLKTEKCLLYLCGSCYAYMLFPLLLLWLHYHITSVLFVYVYIFIFLFFDNVHFNGLNKPTNKLKTWVAPLGWTPGTKTSLLTQCWKMDGWGCWVEFPGSFVQDSLLDGHWCSMLYTMLCYRQKVGCVSSVRWSNFMTSAGWMRNQPGHFFSSRAAKQIWKTLEDICVNLNPAMTLRSFLYLFVTIYPRWPLRSRFGFGFIP